MVRELFSPSILPNKTVRHPSVQISMIINSQSKYQGLSKPEFCYFCGIALADGSVTNKDHCPPKRVFRPSDLVNYPTILEVHKRCHEMWSAYDERYAAIFAVSSRNAKALSRRETVLRSQKVDGLPSARIIYNAPMEKLYYRVCRFAHALFYKQFLPDGTPVQVFGPAVELNQDLTPKKHFSALMRKLSDQLLCAQSHGAADGIVSHSNKFKYVCTWDLSDEGRSMCIFAFDIMNSANLRPARHSRPSCVIGFYQWPRPPDAPSVPRARIEFTEEQRLMPILLPDQDT